MGMARRVITSSAAGGALMMLLMKEERRVMAFEAVKEPFTGISFPRHKDDDYVLLGTAVRCMLGQCKVAKARAYAVGLYVESKDKSNPILNQSSDEEVFEKVLREPVPRRLVLIMDKDVAGHHIAKGFDRSLVHRVRKAQGGKRQGPGKDALRQLTQCFNKEKVLQKGTEVSFIWRPDNSLVISINSSVRETIDSSILCQCLFEMYLGQDSIFKKYRNMAFTLHPLQGTESNGDLQIYVDDGNDGTRA